jgi:hypothetical protein
MRESPDTRFRDRNGIIRAVTTSGLQVDTDMQSTFDHTLIGPDLTPVPVR